MAKCIIGIVVVALIGVGLWYSGALKTLMTPPAPAQQTATTTPQTQQAAAQPENGMSANNDASDAAITQDAAAVDAQMQGLNNDSANVDSSMSDKSVQ